MKRYSPEDVLKMVGERSESDAVPTAVRKVLERDEGKLLTKRILDKLPGGESQWRIRHMAGMTHLESIDHVRTNGAVGYSFLLAYAEKGVKVDVAFLLDRNKSYFGAANARNEQRARVSLGLARQMADALNAVSEARARLTTAEAAMDNLTKHGGPFHADWYFWEGLVKDKETRRC